jgi:hypothetical protein
MNLFTLLPHNLKSSWCPKLSFVGKYFALRGTHDVSAMEWPTVIKLHRSIGHIYLTHFRLSIYFYAKGDTSCIGYNLWSFLLSINSCSYSGSNLAPINIGLDLLPSPILTCSNSSADVNPCPSLHHRLAGNPLGRFFIADCLDRL